MNPTSIFNEILKNVKNSKGELLFPNGVYSPLDASEAPNHSTYLTVEKRINLLLQYNKEFFELKNPHFNLIHCGSINACADATTSNNHFIGFTLGLVDFSQFILKNCLRDNEFLFEFLGESFEEVYVINHHTFKNWHPFILKNSLNSELMNLSLKNIRRDRLANELFIYFSIFIHLHEIGHLKQKKNKFFSEFDSIFCTSDNLKSQVYEMDADYFAVHRLASNLIGTYNTGKKNIPESDSNILIFESKEILVRCTLFILITTFFIFGTVNGFNKETLDTKHPNPALRLTYCIEMLVNIFIQEGFINEKEKDKFGKKTVNDFKKIIEKIFSNLDLVSFLNLTVDTELLNHHNQLQLIAQTMNDLNGSGYYTPNF